MRRIFVPLLLLAFLPTFLPAQTPAQTTAPRGPDGRTVNLVPGVDVLPLPGAPFSAISTITWTRQAAEGASVVTYGIAKVSRDSQGRVYRERHHFSPNPNVDPRTTLFEFSVRDPLAHTFTHCIRVEHTCTIQNFRSQTAVPALQPVGPFDGGKRYLTRESLGNQTIEELAAVGTMETVTIAVGTIGNDRPLKSTREFWYSPDLQTNLKVTRIDPREGTQDVRLTAVSRTEPDPGVFAIPTGYTVRDLHSSSDIK